MAGRAYGITGSEALSYGQAAEMLSSEIGKKVNYVNISDEDVRKGMRDMGADDWTCKGLCSGFQIVKAHYHTTIVLHRHLTSFRAQHLTGLRI